MEERIQVIQKYFKDEHNKFVSSQNNPNNTSALVNEQSKNNIMNKVSNDEPKPIPKNAHPLMMNKINKYRRDLEKNNMKKQQQAFVSDGNIDDWEKELGLKPFEY